MSEATFALDLRKAAVAAWEQTDGQLQTALSKHLVVSFMGSASSGKDSGIKALFGIDFGDISPVPGSTRELRAAKLDAEGQVILLNAPGFGDVRGDVDEVARNAAEMVDIFVYVVNAEGGATADEKRDLDWIRRLERPVLVCINKIDLIRPADRDHFVAATLGQLAVDPRDAVITAFAPHPKLSPDPIGVEYVIDWIGRRLEESGKALMFAKHLRNKAAACEPIIQAAARNASIAGAVPIPGADIAVVTAIQVKLIRDVAVVHGQTLDKDVVAFILAELLAGGMRGFVRWGVEGLKAAGWVPGGQFAEAAILALSATVAGATTYGVGKATVAWIQSGRKMEGDALRAAFDMAAFAWKDKTAGRK